MNDLQNMNSTSANVTNPGIMKLCNQSFSNNSSTADNSIGIADIKNLTSAQLQRKSKDFLLSAVDILLNQINGNSLNHSVCGTKDELTVLVCNIKNDISNAMQEVNSKLSILTDELLTYKHKHDNLEAMALHQAEEISRIKTQINSIDTKLNDEHKQIYSKLNKLNSDLDAINNKLTDLPFLGCNSAPSSTPITPTTDDFKFKVKISGLKEVECKNHLMRSENDLKAVSEILNFLSLGDLKVVDLARIGTFSLLRSRPLMIKLPSIWDVRKIIAKASLMKNYSTQRIYISLALNEQDRLKEKMLLKKRFELVSAGTDKARFKIRNLKLFLDNVEVNCNA